MLIVGITGPIGHGKSAFADALAELVPSTVHFEAGLVVSEVAQALQDALHDIPDPYNVEALNSWLHTLPAILLNTVHVRCAFKDIELHQKEMERHPIEYQKLILHVENLKRNPKMLDMKITPENKENFRPLLQWLGGYLVQKLDAGIWYNEILRRVNDVGAAGGELCIIGGLRYPTDAAILRSAGATIINIYRPGHLQSDTLDPTERERDNIQADCTIMSNGTLEDLKECAKQVLADLRVNELNKTYRTARD